MDDTSLEPSADDIDYWDPDDPEPEAFTRRHRKPLRAEWRHRWWVDEDHSPLPCLFDADGYPVIQFDPVPQRRRRRKGWDADRQRAFIAMLARVPSVRHAALSVGMSPRSAYLLLDKPEAQGFARAWDMAYEYGIERLARESLPRAMYGEFVPVVRRGQLKLELRRNDKLAIALINGASRDIDAHRRGAQVRWRQKREWDKVVAERKAEQKAQLAYLEESARDLAEMIERAAAERLPRIRWL